MFQFQGWSNQSPGVDPRSREERRGVTLVGNINGFSSSTYLPPFCTCVHTMFLFSSEFQLKNIFIQRLALFQYRSGSVGNLSGQKLGDVRSLMVRAQDTPSPSPDAQTTVQSRSSPRMSPTPADSSSVTSLFPLIKFSLSCQIPPLDLATTERRMPSKNQMF